MQKFEGSMQAMFAWNGANVWILMHNKPLVASTGNKTNALLKKCKHEIFVSWSYFCNLVFHGRVMLKWSMSLSPVTLSPLSGW